MTPPILGAAIGPIHQHIDARWLMAYAAGVGETDARYFDTLRASGPMAHPLFPVCYEWPAAVALRDATIPAGLQPRSVHATHHVTIHRLPRAGDHLLTSARVIDLRARRSGTLVVARFETTDLGGEPVTTTDYGSVYRDISLPDATPSPSPRAEAPAGDGEPSRANPPPSEAASPFAAGAAPRWMERVDVTPTLAWTYTECARIWNPIHTDVAVARNAGLAAPILHGTATLALAVSRALARSARADAASVRAISARFTGMVPMPSTLTVRGRETVDGLGFDVVNEHDEPVLTAGRLRIA